MANIKAKDIAHAVFHAVVVKEEKSENVLERIETYLEKIGRIDMYPLVLSYVKILVTQNASRNSVRIESPYKVSASLQKEIIAQLTDEKVSHDADENKDMIGGFEAEYKDRKMGLSMRENILQFKKHLTR